MVNRRRCRSTTTAPDGYTVLANGLPLATNPGIFAKLPYNPIDDFVPVSLLVIQPNVLVVNGALPFKTVGELVQYAKAHPGNLNFASSGIGTSQHLAGEMFRRLAGVDIVHVPYRSGAAALVDLIGGQVQMMFDPLTSAVPYIQAGQLRGLAVTTTQRSPALPDLPSLSEAGVANFESRGWVGLLAPAGTPPKIVDKLNNAVVRSLQDASVKERLGKLGLNVVGNTSAEFSAFLRAEINSWTVFTKDLKIKLD